MALQRKLLSKTLRSLLPKWGWIGATRGFAASATSPPELPPFDHQPRPYKGPLADEVLEKRKKYLGPSLFYYYQKPVYPSPFSLSFRFMYGCICTCAITHTFCLRMNRLHDYEPIGNSTLHSTSH